MNKEEQAKAEEKILKEIVKWPAAHPKVIISSSSKGYGIRDVQDSIVEVLQHL